MPTVNDSGAGAAAAAGATGVEGAAASSSSGLGEAGGFGGSGVTGSDGPVFQNGPGGFDAGAADGQAGGGWQDDSESFKWDLGAGEEGAATGGGEDEGSGVLGLVKSLWRLVNDEE